MESHQHSGKCEEVFALLSDYLNVELPADACKAIETHLASCSPCVDFLESLRKTVELCRQYSLTELPAPMAETARQELLAAYRKMVAGK